MRSVTRLTAPHHAHPTLPPRQARYSEENNGHFGLAAPYYTHFTSPIRRYPDLLLHRICATRYLGDEGGRLTAEQIAPIAKLSSERERIAEAAERDSIEMKKVQYMERHLGAEFSGTISDVRAFGFFVLLDDVFVDGLVHVSSMEDDYYAFQEEAYSLVGQNTGRTFRLGDRVLVQVASVDREARRIDFIALEREGAAVGARAAGGADRAGSPRSGKSKARGGGKERSRSKAGGKRPGRTSKGSGGGKSAPGGGRRGKGGEGAESGGKRGSSGRSPGTGRRGRKGPGKGGPKGGGGRGRK